MFLLFGLFLVLIFYFYFTCHNSHLIASLNLLQAHSPVVANKDRYDPVFILRFSIHSLSLGYIEPVEFASLGLLAVAFVSMSSSDDRIRKLGYETLGLFKHALEVMLCSIACFCYIVYVHVYACLCC